MSAFHSNKKLWKYTGLGCCCARRSAPQGRLVQDEADKYPEREDSERNLLRELQAANGPAQSRRFVHEEGGCVFKVLVVSHLAIFVLNRPWRVPYLVSFASAATGSGEVHHPQSAILGDQQGIRLHGQGPKHSLHHQFGRIDVPNIRRKKLSLLRYESYFRSAYQ